MIYVLVGVVVALVLVWASHGDGLIHCPVCNTTKLAQYGLGSFQQSFQCENGHRFSAPVPGP